MKIAQALLAIQAAALWWFTWSRHITVGWLLALATMNGLITAFEIPARQSLVIELVGRDDLPGAIALNSSGFNLARVVGPSIGAIIIASLGIAWCFGVNAASYITVLVGLFLIRLPAWTPPEHLASPIEGIREGVRYMRDTPSIAALMRLVTVYSVLGVPYLTLMPVVARDRLGLDAGGYGAMLACVGVGGVSGALFLAAIGDRVQRGRLLFVASFAYAILLLSFALVRSAGLAYPILLAVGFTMIVNNALCNSTVQHLVPNELRGRMMAAYSFVVVGLSAVLGSVVAGSVAHAVGVSWAIGGGAAIMLVYAYYAFFRRSELRNGVNAMYSTCIFCHASLGANESIEHFPVGHRLAFDASRGRLWVVCRNASGGTSRRSRSGGKRSRSASARSATRGFACPPTTSVWRACAKDSSSSASASRSVRRWRRGGTAINSAGAGESTSSTQARASRPRRDSSCSGPSPASSPAARGGCGTSSPVNSMYQQRRSRARVRAILRRDRSPFASST